MLVDSKADPQTSESITELGLEIQADHQTWERGNIEKGNIEKWVSVVTHKWKFPLIIEADPQASWFAPETGTHSLIIDVLLWVKYSKFQSSIKFDSCNYCIYPSM